MSRAPFVLPRATDRLPRTQELVDTALGWRLVNPQMPAEHTISLGMTAEVLAAEYSISREAQDRFAVDSHEKALAAQAAGAFDAELVPVRRRRPRRRRRRGAARRHEPRTARRAAPGVRRRRIGDRRQLQPAQRRRRRPAAGQRRGCERLGLAPLARVVTWASAGVEPRRMGIGPAPAMRLALDRAGWKLDDLDVIELNEAFAAQALAVVAELGLDPARINPRGGAIALGHPLGCSGARIATTLVHQLRALGPGHARGAATMCIGVGQGIATLFEAV